MMSLSKRRTVGMWTAVLSLLPMLIAAAAFVVWLDARWHWPFAKRWWWPSPLDETWVWVSAFAIGPALALISRCLTPDEWEGRRDQLNSPMDDEAHIVRADELRGCATPRAKV